jgi:hypothetical protein
LLLRTYAAHQDKASMEEAAKINLAVPMKADNVIKMKQAANS